MDHLKVGMFSSLTDLKNNARLFPPPFPPFRRLDIFFNVLFVWVSNFDEKWKNDHHLENYSFNICFDELRERRVLLLLSSVHKSSLCIGYIILFS